MGSINETKKLAKLMGVLIALPSGIFLGVNTDLIYNKVFGDTSGRSLFPFPIFLFPVALIVLIVIYKVVSILSEKYITSENYKIMGIRFIVINAVLIIGILVWKFMHP